MFANSSHVLVLLMAAISISSSEEMEHFFRTDYTYIKDTESFYKIHTLRKTWDEAKVICEREGATLFYPEDTCEAEVIISHWNKTQPTINWIFIGIADWNVKEVFETIDGRPISDVYDAWAHGEPNDVDGVEGCVVMEKEGGTLNDDQCNRHMQFICKKPLALLQWNHLCHMPDPFYEYSTLLDKCYKFHLKPQNWTEAYAICRAEQSYLAIINSELEATYLVNLTARADKDKVLGDYLRGAVHLGFKNQDGWVTTNGVPLHLSGYSVWGYSQPDGGEKEKCGSMFYNGHLNDIGCFHKMFFICEHDIKIRGEMITLRFSDS